MGDALREKLLRIKQPLVLRSFNLLLHTGGELYIRDEVIDTYNHLNRAYSLQEDRRLLRGVLLTGQPGLGKSTEIVHIIAIRMSLKLPTLFTATNNVFWISKDGVQRFSQPASSIMTHHLDLLDLSSRPWSLVDAHRDAPAPSVALFANPLFPIYATLPNVTRYKQWVKDQRPMTHIMQPWDWDKEDWLNWLVTVDLIAIYMLNCLLPV